MLRMCIDMTSTRSSSIHRSDESLVSTVLPVVVFLLAGLLPTHTVLATEYDRYPNVVLLGNVISRDKARSNDAVAKLRNHWQPAYTAPLVELLALSSDSGQSAAIVELLEKKTRKTFAYDISAWYRWIWSQKIAPMENYAEFKSWLYGNIDPNFAGYFSSDRASEIDLDEIRWGGVRQDGIPPLHSPEMISAAEAAYLDDSNVVFAIEINGDYRAYPKRIMAWHEMFTDTVGGRGIAGVYCTLCGSMIIYETHHDGTDYKLGTSGFLFRSNKLMYDHATQSLWNSLWGRPVVGPLAGKGIKLKRGSIITTTWGEWKSRHPQTSVLSLNTGYGQDYGEGVAYKDYFATDELMFNVPELDTRLKNKAEVLGIVFARQPEQPLAISVDYLGRHPLYHDRIGDQAFVVVTDTSGASRMYASGATTFADWDGRQTLVDSNGDTWTLQESKLTNAQGEELHRLPAHRAFWFGWYSAYSRTRLVY